MFPPQNFQPGSYQKAQKLETLLPSTCYGQSKELVRKYVHDLITNYASLDFRVISQISAPTSRVLEIYGNLPINYQGNTYFVILSMVFPPLFPNVGPAVSFVNPDMARFKALQKYEIKKNPDGKSYPIWFSEIVNWTTHKNILRVMVQVCSEFAKEYPLYEMTQPPHFFDNYPAVNNKPVTKVDTNYTMNPFQNNGGSSERDQYINKIRKKYFDESMTIAKKMEADLNFQRTSMVDQQTMYLKLQDEEAKMTKFENDAPLLISDLYNKVTQLKSFIQSNESTQLSADNLSFVLTEADEKSRAIIELVSNNRAIEDLNAFLENYYKNDKVDTEQLLKHYKDNSDKEFFNKHLIKRLTSL